MPDPPSHNWIVVASADHVRKGGAGGFMQAGHGKLAPLRRVRSGDRIACYSPATAFGGKDRLQAFTAFGTVRDGEPYRVDMGDGFQPFRRDVDWLAVREVPIQPLLERLEFTSGQRNWGFKFRLGLFTISDHDMDIIAAAMTGSAATRQAM